MSTRSVDPARSRVVLVGTPAYSDPLLPDVPVVANNITDLAAVLTDPQVGGFDAAHCIKAPPGASLGDIGALLVQGAAEAEDLLLFYYSGHGLLGPRRRELFLSLADTRCDRMVFTALAFDAVRDACLDSRAASRVVILDCCFSGRAIGETLADDVVLGQLEVTGTYTLTSAPANRTALILPGEKHTAFTERLLHLLRTGSPGAGATLSLGDIYRHLHAQLRAEGLPAPQQRGTETADLLGIVPNRHPILTPIPTAEPELEQVNPPIAATQDGPLVIDRLPRQDHRRISSTAPSADAPESSSDPASRLGNAERIAQTITNRTRKAEALALIAQAAADRDPDRAGPLIEQVESAAAGVAGWSAKAEVLVHAAVAAAGTDQHYAALLTDHAERAVQKESWELRKVETLAKMAVALAGSEPGRAATLIDQAERIANATDGLDKVQALLSIAGIVADSYQRRAVLLTSQAEHAAQSGEALCYVVRAIVGSDVDRAERIARAIPEGPSKASALVYVLESMARIDPDRAALLIEPAEFATRATALGLSYKNSLLGRISGAVAYFDPDRALGIAHTISSYGGMTENEALAVIVEGVARNDPNRAERIAYSIHNQSDKEVALASLARVMAASNPDRAERIVARARLRGELAASVAEAVVGSNPEGAERIAKSITDDRYKAVALASLTREVARNDPDRAERIASTITISRTKDAALSSIVEAVADSDPSRGEQIANTIRDESAKNSALYALVRALASNCGAPEHTAFA